jgi:hypothetical protein
MRILAIVFGAVLLIVAVRGRETDAGGEGTGTGNGLWPLLKQDFEPGQKGNFLAWFAAILIIGMLGYIPQLKPFSNSLLALIIVVLLVASGKPGQANGGFFQKLQQAISQKAA